MGQNERDRGSLISRGTVSRWLGALPGGALVGVAVRHFVRALPRALLVAGVILFFGCRQSFDYYNPLDPAEDAPISEILPYIQDPVIRQAIIQSGAQTKRDLGWLEVNGWDHGNVVTTAGLEFLSYTRDLRLAGVGLETVDLAPLTRMRSLRGLGLEQNQFDDTTVSTIPHLPQLEHLSLHGNALNDAGSVAPLISRYPRGGISIDLGWNDEIDPGTLIALRPVLERLHGLGLNGIDVDGLALFDLSFLVSNSTISNLNVSDNRGINNYGALSLLSELRYLGLWNNDIDESRFLTLPFLPRLHSIGLGNNQISDLSVLVPWLSSYERGRLNLSIGENPFGLEQLWDLRPVLDRLYDLDITWGDEAGPVWNLDFLPQNDTIRYLRVSRNMLSDLNGIRRLTALEELEIWDTWDGSGYAWGSEALLDLPRLNYVNAWGSCVEPWVLEELGRRGVWVDY